MEIKFSAGTSLYGPGDFCGCLIGAGFGQVVLCEASEKEEGVEIEIKADRYSINKKYYPLGEGYTVKAVLTEDKRLVPLLRKAHGTETVAIQNVIQGSYHVPAKKIGPKAKSWPIINCADLDSVGLGEVEVIEDALRYASVISKVKEEEVAENLIKGSTEEEVEETEI
jgi:hypothetical protein